MRAAWDANAAFWDERLSRPDSWQHTLIFPALERLLAVGPGETALEIACGSGLLAERLAAAGVRVLAFDFSEAMIERARARVSGPAVEFRVVDATDERQLLELGEGRFDAAVCSMALMDMADVGPLAAALPRLLAPGGRFVFSITHPCFNGPGLLRVVKATGGDGDIVTTHAVKASEYIRPRHGQGIGIPGQPAPQFYFERPLSVLFETFFRSGFVLDGLEEPVDAAGTFEPDDPDKVWEEIPPVLAARMRLVQ